MAQALSLCAGVSLLALAWPIQPVSAEEEPVRIGPGITPPRVIKKIEPKYSEEARRARIQGTAFFEIVVDTNGKATNIQLLSPLGFGLDARAQAAIEAWDFVPGAKDGKPVPVLATVEVNFRLLGEYFDQKAEQQRTEFNVMLRSLDRAKGKPDEKMIRTIEHLARDKFVPAMYLLGKWQDAGVGVPKDPDRGLDLIKKAADKNYGPALYEIGHRYLVGRGFPQDPEKGMKMIRESAVLGSLQAQYFLATHYESGEGFERDPARARQFYRLCAAKGDAKCQYNLGRLLFNQPQRKEREYLQALAWLQLAAAQNLRGD